MGVWTAGDGVPEVRGDGDDAQAGGAGTVDVLVSGVSAVGGGGGADGGGTGGWGVWIEAAEGWVLAASEGLTADFHGGTRMRGDWVGACSGRLAAIWNGGLR